MLLICVFTASLSHLSSFEWWILIIFPWNVRIDQDPMGLAGTSCCCAHLPVNPRALEETASEWPKTKPCSYLCLSPGYIYTPIVFVCELINLSLIHFLPSSWRLHPTFHPQNPPQRCVALRSIISEIQSPVDFIRAHLYTRAHKLLRKWYCSFWKSSLLGECDTEQWAVLVVITRGHCSLINPTYFVFISLVFEMQMTKKNTIQKTQ